MRLGEDISGKGLWTIVDSWVERGEGEVGWCKKISRGFLCTLANLGLRWWSNFDVGEHAVDQLDVRPVVGHEETPVRVAARNH